MHKKSKTKITPFKFSEKPNPLAENIVTELNILIGKTGTQEGIPGLQIALAAMSENLHRLANFDDVFENILSLTKESIRSESQGRAIPAVTLPQVGTIPVIWGSLNSLLKFQDNYVSDSLFESLSKSGLEIKQLNRSQVLEGIFTPLYRFIALRIEAENWLKDILLKNITADKTNAPVQPDTLGYGGNFHVTLTSQNTGWRASVSPAYMIRFNYFGSPTSPVSGYLPAGYWVFGGDHPMSANFVVDTTVFDIPTTLTPCVHSY